MELPKTQPAARPNEAPSEMRQRMLEARHLVRPWFDPAFRAGIDRSIPEVVGRAPRSRWLAFLGRG